MGNSAIKTEKAHKKKHTSFLPPDDQPKNEPKSEVKTAVATPDVKGSDSGYGDE